MRKVKVITDSTSDLPKGILYGRGIDTVPRQVILDDKSYPDDGSLKNEDLFEFERKTGILPKTSAVSQYQLEDAFKKWLAGDCDIFFTGLSGKLSDTVQTAQMAAYSVAVTEKLDRKRISIFDSLSLSCGTGLLALEAADMADRGAGLSEITEHALKLRDKVQASFVVDTLKYLYMSGRSSKLTSAVAGGLNLKPKLELKAGEIVPGTNFIGKNYIYDYCDQIIKRKERIDPRRIFIAHCLAAEAGDIKEKLEKVFGFGSVILTGTSPATSVLCGPGTLGIFFLYK